MNKDELVSMIIYGINKAFNGENDPFNSIININECYFMCQNDIRKIGKSVIDGLSSNMTDDSNDSNNDDYTDKMISDYYYIFKYKGYYTIINYKCDIWNMAEFQLRFMKTRSEALINRYGD